MDFQEYFFSLKVINIYCNCQHNDYKTTNFLFIYIYFHLHHLLRSYFHCSIQQQLFTRNKYHFKPSQISSIMQFDWIIDCTKSIFHNKRKKVWREKGRNEFNEGSKNNKKWFGAKWHWFEAKWHWFEAKFYNTNT